MFGLLITENSGGYIMKKSSLYFIYGLLFIIIANTSGNKLVIGLTAIAAVLNIFTAFILAYLEDKYK